MVDQRYHGESIRYRIAGFANRSRFFHRSAFLRFTSFESRNDIIAKVISDKPPSTPPSMAPIAILGSLSGGDAVDGDALEVTRIKALEAMLAVRVINAFAIGDAAGERR
jgi:hypothetical protein